MIHQNSRISLTYGANSIKVVLPKALTVNYENAGDDGLLPVFSSKLEIISLKQHQGHITFALATPRIRFKALSHGAISLATCNTILLFGDVKLPNTCFHQSFLIYS